MKTSLKQFVTLASALLITTAAYAVEESTWGQVKAQIDKGATPAAKAVTSTIHDAVPFAFDEDTPCGRFTFGGTVNLLIHTTADGNGGFHIKGLASPSNDVTGSHEDGGTIHATGGTHFEGTNIGPGQVTNFVNNFKVIGEGATPNLLIHDVIRTTINANGTITSTLTIESFECK